MEQRSPFLCMALLLVVTRVVGRDLPSGNTAEMKHVMNSEKMTTVGSGGQDDPIRGGWGGTLAIINGVVSLVPVDYAEGATRSAGFDGGYSSFINRLHRTSEPVGYTEINTHRTSQGAGGSDTINFQRAYSEPVGYTGSDTWLTGGEGGRA